jgi:hypothetical protein
MNDETTPIIIASLGRIETKVDDGFGKVNGRLAAVESRVSVLESLASDLPALQAGIADVRENGCLQFRDHAESQGRQWHPAVKWSGIAAGGGLSLTGIITIIEAIAKLLK